MNKNIRFPQKEKQPKKLIRAMKFFSTFCTLDNRIMFCFRNIFSRSIILYELRKQND